MAPDSHSITVTISAFDNPNVCISMIIVKGNSTAGNKIACNNSQGSPILLQHVEHIRVVSILCFVVVENWNDLILTEIKGGGRCKPRYI